MLLIIYKLTNTIKNITNNIINNSNTNNNNRGGICVSFVCSRSHKHHIKLIIYSNKALKTVLEILFNNFIV